MSFCSVKIVIIILTAVPILAAAPYRPRSKVVDEPEPLLNVKKSDILREIHIPAGVVQGRAYPAMTVYMDSKPGILIPAYFSELITEKNTRPDPEDVEDVEDVIEHPSDMQIDVSMPILNTVNP